MSAINHIWTTPIITTSSTSVTPANTASNYVVVGGGGGGSTHTAIGTGQHSWSMSDLRAVDLNDPVFDMPLESLRAAWLACFGSGWVGEDQIQEHTMRLIYSRLKALRELEVYNAIDSYHPKARLIKREVKCET